MASRPNDCSVTLPVEIDVTVKVRSKCNPFGASRTRGGMTAEILHIDGNLNGEKEISLSMSMKPMYMLQEIIKKQKNILAGLATSGPLNFHKQKKSLHQIQNKINNDEQQHNYDLVKDNDDDDDNDEQQTQQHKKIVGGNRNKFHAENYKNINEQVKTIASGGSTRKPHNRNNHMSHISEKYIRGGSFESQILSSLVSDLELLETDHDDSSRDIQEKTKGKNKRLKGGDVIGIPHDIKKAAMLKGAQMCRTRLSKVDLAKRKIKSAHRTRRSLMKLRFPEKSIERLKCDMLQCDKTNDKNYENGQDNKFFEKSAIEHKKKTKRISEKNCPFERQLDTKLSRVRLRGGMNMMNDEKRNKRRCACNCSGLNKKTKNRKFSKNKKDIYGWLEKIEPFSDEDTMHMEGYMHSNLSKSNSLEKIHQPITKNKNIVEEPSSSSSKNSLNTKNKNNVEEPSSSSSKNSLDTKNMEITTLHKAKSNKINKKHFQSNFKPKCEINQEPSYEKISELLKIHRTRSKFRSKILKQSKSRICACCMHRKPANADQTLAISRRLNLKENFVNDAGDNREISLYKNTVTRFSRVHKKRTLADPLDTLRKVSEKLEELQSITGKPPGMDSKTVVVNHDMYHSFSGRKKQKKTRSFYDSQRKLQEYEKCYSETSSESSDSTFN